MKRIHLIFLSLVLLLGTSCASKSDIENLQGQIDGLKTGQIATISQQITAIQNSIKALEGVDANLNGTISNLRSYVDDELSSIKEWDKATFLTLEKYQETLNDLAELKKKVKDIDVQAAIAAAEVTMKGWVNEQLSGYYTMAQIDAKLKDLVNADKDMADAMQKAKTDLTDAYTKAITEAITKYNGEITLKIAADIKLATDELQRQIDDLEIRIATLEKKVTSISITPDYSDGSVEAVDGVLKICCTVTPVDATELADRGLESFSIMMTSTKTKALSGGALHPYMVISTELEDYLEVELYVDITPYLPVAEGQTLGFKLGFFGSQVQYVTEYFNITTVFTSNYDAVFSEKIAGNVWRHGNSVFFLDLPMGMFINNDSGNMYSYGFDHVYFLDEDPSIFRGEEGHYKFYIYQPATTPYYQSSGEPQLVTFQLEDDTHLIVRYWTEENGAYQVKDKFTAEQFCRIRDYRVTKVPTTMFNLFFDGDTYHDIFLGGFSTLSTTLHSQRLRSLEGKGGEYEYVYVGTGKYEDYAGLDVTGKCVIMDEGDISLEQKWITAMKAGAVFAIVFSSSEQVEEPDLGTTYRTSPLFLLPHSERSAFMDREEHVVLLDEFYW